MQKIQALKDQMKMLEADLASANEELSAETVTSRKYNI